ncbi:MAG: DegV family protein [Oscillospiraceae bacterium]|nr:DegV family protein [Oscillospiraceae bacterium]
MSVKISADSTCDMPKELCEKYDISITPLYVVRDGVSYKDGIEIGRREIYAHFDATGRTCSTAAVSVSDYLEFFSEQLKTHESVVHFHISSEMSACWQNACIAAQELGNVYPVDTRTLCSGMALLMLEAVDMAAQGASGAEIQAAMPALSERLDASFVVSTLTYLARGGRCSSVTALGANLLNLKPCIELRGGFMEVGKKYRGSLQKVLPAYVRDRLADGRADPRRLFLVNSGGISDELVQATLRDVTAQQSFDEIHLALAGSTICSHCGPGTLGVMFFRK